MIFKQNFFDTKTASMIWFHFGTIMELIRAMATLTIKNLPDNVYTQLKQAAASHRRSINSEVIVCLERSLIIPVLNVPETLKKIRSLRKATVRGSLTNAVIVKARNEGRP